MAFSALHFTKLPETDGVAWYRLDKPLLYTFQFGTKLIAGRVPAGFKTDLASIPGVLQSIFPHDGKYTEAAILHDFLYGKAVCSRWMADAIFREGMKNSGVSVWVRFTLWLAVRIFGGSHFSKKENPEKTKAEKPRPVKRPAKKKTRGKHDA